MYEIYYFRGCNIMLVHNFFCGSVYNGDLLYSVHVIVFTQYVLSQIFFSFSANSQGSLPTDPEVQANASERDRAPVTQLFMVWQWNW